MAEQIQRGKPNAEKPFCWQSKVARRRIRDRLDGTEDICSALSIYDALTEIASDAGSPTFETTHAFIGLRSGLSPATVKRRLPVLTEIGMISVREQVGLKGPCTYTILSMAHNEPASGQDERTIAHDRNGASRATSEELLKKKKKLKNGTSETGAGAPGGVGHLRLPSHFKEVETFAELEGINREVAIKWCKLNDARHWQLRNPSTGLMQPIFNWQATLRKFAAKDRTLPKVGKDDMTNDQFWAMVREMDDSEDAIEAANSWIRMCGDNHWQRKNKLTGEMEPIFDYNASFSAFYRETWPTYGISAVGHGA